MAGDENDAEPAAADDGAGSGEGGGDAATEGSAPKEDKKKKSWLDTLNPFSKKEIDPKEQKRLKEMAEQKKREEAAAKKKKEELEKKRAERQEQEETVTGPRAFNGRPTCPTLPIPWLWPIRSRARCTGHFCTGTHGSEARTLPAAAAEESGSDKARLPVSHEGDQGGELDARRAGRLVPQDHLRRRLPRARGSGQGASQEGHACREAIQDHPDWQAGRRGVALLPLRIWWRVRARARATERWLPLCGACCHAGSERATPHLHTRSRRVPLVCSIPVYWMGSYVQLEMEEFTIDYMQSFSLKKSRRRASHAITLSALAQGSVIQEIILKDEK